MARASAPVNTASSFEEYLALEKASPTRHEFVDGRVFAMAGGSRRHARIGFRLATLLEGARGDCIVYASDVLVRTPNDVGYYPNVVVTCDPEDDDEYVVRRPCLIAEVLSSSTEAIDRGEKLLNHRRLESLDTYMLVSQDEVRAEVYQRQPDGSWRHEIIEAGGVLGLPCVNLELPLAAVYKGV